MLAVASSFKVVQPLYCEVITAIPTLAIDHKCMAVPRHRQCAGPGGGCRVGYAVVHS